MARFSATLIDVSVHEIGVINVEIERFLVFQAAESESHHLPLAGGYG
jgi:hypothetical protein